MNLMLYALIGLPTVAGVAALLLRGNLVRRCLLVVAALGHLGLTIAIWNQQVLPVESGQWLALDGPGKLFLGVMSLLFAASALYCFGYLERENLDLLAGRTDSTNESEQIFIGCLLFFEAAMTLVTMSQHFGLLWVAIEATTLASAPLIYFHRHNRSLEATWKYLLICSVGIALALMGVFLLAVAATGTTKGQEPIPLTVMDLISAAAAGKLDHSWLHIGFLFVLVGFGTKMGLAPMHNALPDADSEAPSAVGALLSGALLNCAFLGILRYYQVCAAAGEGAFCQQLFIIFGLLSMAVAGAFIIGQGDFRRLLAYSSIEHMGIICLAVGIGGPVDASLGFASSGIAASCGAFAAALHSVNHSLTKAALFLLSGNIRHFYNSRVAADVRGAVHSIPWTGGLWVACILAIVGVPPFGPFLSEFLVLKAALDQGQYFIAILYLLLLAVVFVGMTSVALSMAFGKPPEGEREATAPEPIWAVAPPAVLCLLVVALGLYLPEQLKTALVDAAAAWGVGK